MLREILKTQQVANCPLKRWFNSEYFDLMVFYECSAMTRFELYYDKGINEKVLIYELSGFCSHYKVDDGENDLLRPKMTPIYQMQNEPILVSVIERFKQESSQIDWMVVQQVVKILLELKVP